MSDWLEWFIGYGQNAGSELITLLVFQGILAFTITTTIAPKQWSMARIMLTALVWPLTLIVLMVGKPVKAIRNRRDPQLALDQLARRHRDESRPALEQDASIAFWRAQLTAESEVERECAVRMLTDVYAVLLEEPKPEPTGTESDPLDLSRYIAPGDYSHLHAKPYVMPPSGGRSQVCRFCLGAGYDQAELRPCSACEGWGVIKPYAYRRCPDCNQFFRFCNEPPVPLRCPTCSEEHGQILADTSRAAIRSNPQGMNYDPVAVAGEANPVTVALRQFRFPSAS